MSPSSPTVPKPPSVALRAPVHEVFASIQGEGAFVGEPQVFLRLAGCPMRCRWCDTPATWGIPPSGEDDEGGMARGARIAGPEAARREEPWVSPFGALVWIAEVEGAFPRTVSVTGGEPLLWPEFLLELRTLLGERRLHLETGGGHPRALEAVLDAVDHVSLDLKLPSDLDPPVELALSASQGDESDESESTPTDDASWEIARRRALELVAGRDGAGACAKIVVAGAHRDHPSHVPREYAPLLDDVAELAPGLAVYLQPATPMGGVAAPTDALVDGLVDEALARSLDVRVVPQVHRALRRP